VSTRAAHQICYSSVIVLDKRERIVECNVAAGVLLRRTPEMLRAAPLRDILPRDVASALGAAAFHPDGAPNAIRLKAPNGGDVWVEAVCTPFVEGEGLAQVVLRDVTEQERRQAGLETYAAHILRAQEEERQRIAQELHDETVQSLIVLCRKLDHGKLHPGASASNIEVLREAHADVESIVESVRGFARGLRPPTLDDLGLTPAIDRLLRELNSHSVIEGSLAVRGPDQRLPADVELALFRIAQEAVHNIERHSEATHVKMSLEYRPEKTRLVIADDGKGFVSPLPPDDPANATKLGLIGMQERARIVGGKLTIRPKLGEGTRIVAELPRAGQP
jgi:two-component system, NarL family, sensor histidine kinase DegS